MAFVKHHGIKLATGGFVQNMVVESFTNATQPTPSEQG